MAILELRTYPDPILKKVSVPVAQVNDSIRTLIEDMRETMYESRGVGLAAPQIGQSIRLIVLDPQFEKGDQSGFKVLINPEIELLGDKIISEREGCLSVPYDYRADVKRHESVRVKYTNLEGETIEEIWSDFEAIIIQHEFDHLEGILFIDHISRLRRSLYETKVKKNLKRESE